MKACPENIDFIPEHLTLKEARRILGNEANKYSDSELTELILQMFSLAKIYISSVPES